MKYKVGDKVRIIANEGSTNSAKALDGTFGYVTKWDGRHYRVELSALGDWTYCDESELESYPTYKTGDEVEVRDKDCETWIKKTYLLTLNDVFLCCDNSHFPRLETAKTPRTDVHSWKQIRPIETPKMELTLTVDGKQVPISTLSEESLINLHKASKEA